MTDSHCEHCAHGIANGKVIYPKCAGDRHGSEESATWTDDGCPACGERVRVLAGLAVKIVNTQQAKVMIYPDTYLEGLIAAHRSVRGAEE